MGHDVMMVYRGQVGCFDSEIAENLCLRPGQGLTLDQFNACCASAFANACERDYVEAKKR